MSEIRSRIGIAIDAAATTVTIGTTAAITTNRATNYCGIGGDGADGA